MFGLSTSKNKEELALVFDIGSSSVGGALFRMEPSGIPKILFTVREPIVLLDTLEIDQFLPLTMKSLETVAKKISLKGLGAPKRIFAVLSSPWHVSQTRVINLEKNTLFVFNSELADTLTKKEISIFEEEHMANYVHEKSTIRPIELKNMKIMLNGYETASPIGQKAKMLAMTLFVSMSPEEFLLKIEGTIGKYFHTGHIKFSSFAMASFTVVRDLFISQPNFLLIDIGGELTDISMTKKDVLRESISFPLGINFITREIAHGMGCTLDEAKAQFSLYKDGHATKTVEQKLQPIVTKIETEWLKKFQEALANISNDISVPSNIFLTTDPELAEFFSQVIKNEQFNQYTLTEAKFQITYLGSEALHGTASFDEATIRDPFLVMESIYINRYLRHV